MRRASIGHVPSIRSRRPAPSMMRRSAVPIDQVQGRWCLLHVKARNEKAIAWELNDLDLDYFLPLATLPRSYGGRRTSVDIPLFPGYVFFSCISEDDRYAVLGTHRVAKLIEIADQARIRAELEQVRRAVCSSHPVSLYPGIKRGRRCRIKSGCLRGVEGVVSKRGDAGRVFLDVSMLGQSAVVEIDVMLLERAD